MRTNQQIFSEIFGQVVDVVAQPNVPVAPGQETKVAEAVAKEIAPIVVNATNGEPWYRSRVFIGLAASAASLITSKVVGVAVTENDVREWVDIALLLVQAWGLFYAWYGRRFGATKKPLGA